VALLRVRPAGDVGHVARSDFETMPGQLCIRTRWPSDDPHSPHHTDQSELFAAQKWKPIHFTEEDIARNLERSYHP
jgi:acyl-homoserine lactone acylase PvdQ